MAVAGRRDTDDLRSLRDALGTDHDVSLCDVRDEVSTRRWVEAVTERVGAPYALVHAAGPFARGSTSLDASAWPAVFEDNLFSVVRLAGLVVPGLRERGAGRVVVFGHAGVSTLRPPPALAAWYSAKAALLSFARALAAECAADGVTVNCLSPGVIDTGGMDAELFGRMAATVPGGKPGRTDEVAATVRWLLSEEASHVTGAEITVAGGWDLARPGRPRG